MDNFIEYLPQSVAGKTIIITGASTGIGRATAILLSKLGADIIIAGNDPTHLNDALLDIEKVANGKFYGITADLSSEEGVAQLFNEADSKFNSLDVLINNAAIPYESVLNGNYKDWQRVVNTNLLAYMACCAEAYKRMKGSGHIINIGSMSADVREETGSVYVATKSGIQGFSESFRKQVNKDGIKVTLIEPGAVDTDMQPQSTEQKKEMVKDLKMLTADDIAVSILYCLSQPKRYDVVDLKIRPHRQFI